MTEREALKLALEALDCIYSPLHVREIEKVGNAMKAIKEALAQPEQEPVIGTKTWFEDDKVVTQYLHPSDIYTTPPQFKPLTDEQISTSYEEYASKFNNYSNYWQALNSEDHFTEGYMAGWKDAHEARSKT